AGPTRGQGKARVAPTCLPCPPVPGFPGSWTIGLGFLGNNVMRKELEDRLERSQPALIVTYGNTTRKVRPLDRDVLMLGKSSACDVSLKSPEVYPVHALVVRTADGWRVKDCTGRGATRLNGRSVQDEALTDGDMIQIGTFSFQAHLPPVRKS